MTTSTPADAIVSAEVRAYMGRNRISQSALAQHLGISQSSVQRKLSGVRPFNVGDLSRAAELFGVSLNDLLGPADRPSSVA